MKESYREGVANHSGPEPCEGGGNVALEALDRGICRLGIELRNQGFREADGVSPLGRQHCAVTITQVRRSPAESKTPGMQRNSMRENRETPSPPVAVGGPGGEGDEP
jgi:hypothetical protein